MAKLTYEKLIEDFNITHNNKYKYTPFIYDNLYEKINIECPEHGIFTQQIMLHRQGGGCKLCGQKKAGNSIKENSLSLRRQEFLDEVVSKFGNKFDLSKVVYTNTNDKITIGCPEHGWVEEYAGKFKRSKYGCSYCGGTKKLTQEMFLKLVPDSHKEEYDLSETIYTTRQSKIDVICKIHGKFSIRADNFIIGQGCPKCRYIKSSNSKRGNIEDIIEVFKKVHNNKYTYEEIEPYKSRLLTRIKIFCPNHGEFIQPIDRHYSGHGCPTCNSSKGELNIIKTLEKYNVNFINEYSFKDLKLDNSTKPLRFDFYLPDYNSCIEFDGRHHFEDVIGRSILEDVQYRDNLKNKYCEINNIKLLRLDYLMENYGEQELINFLKDLGIE